MMEKPVDLDALSKSLETMREWYSFPLGRGDICRISDDNVRATDAAAELLSALPHLIAQARKVERLEALLREIRTSEKDPYDGPDALDMVDDLLEAYDAMKAQRDEVLEEVKRCHDMCQQENMDPCGFCRKFRLSA